MSKQVPARVGTAPCGEAGKRRGGEEEPTDVMGWRSIENGQKKRGQVKKDPKKRDKKRKVSNRQTGREGWINQEKSGERWEGGCCQQSLLRQCDMAHAINSGSAEGPCLAICSGSGAFERVGVTSTLHPKHHAHTDTENPALPSAPRLADTRPGPRTFP